jgi:hypothetical protein
MNDHVLDHLLSTFLYRLRLVVIIIIGRMVPGRVNAWIVSRTEGSLLIVMAPFNIAGGTVDPSAPFKYNITQLKPNFTP